MFILRRVYIISDNQYFALGIAGLFYKVDANIIRPQDIFDKKQFLEEGMCYVYIKNRKLHQQLCHCFRYMSCKFIFFWQTHIVISKQSLGITSGLQK